MEFLRRDGLCGIYRVHRPTEAIISRSWIEMALNVVEAVRAGQVPDPVEVLQLSVVLRQAIYQCQHPEYVTEESDDGS